MPETGFYRHLYRRAKGLLLVTRRQTSRVHENVHYNATMSAESFVSELLVQPSDAVFHHVSGQLARQFPDNYLLESQSPFFLVSRYAMAGECEFEEQPDLLTQWRVWVLCRRSAPMRGDF